MTLDSTVPLSLSPKSKGDSFVRDGNAPIFMPPHKPHVVFFGHAEAGKQLRALAEALRGDITVSIYVENGDNATVQKSYILHAVDRAELLIFGPSSASCRTGSEASNVETIALERACAGFSPVPLVFALGSKRPGLASTHVKTYASKATMVIVEKPDQTGGLLDIFPSQVHIATGEKTTEDLLKHVRARARPRSAL